MRSRPPTSRWWSGINRFREARRSTRARTARARGEERFSAIAPPLAAVPRKGMGGWGFGSPLYTVRDASGPALELELGLESALGLASVSALAGPAAASGRLPGFSGGWPPIWQVGHSPGR